jgi:hypothetical protein
MKIIQGFIFTCCFFYSCSDGEQVPSGVMKPVQMQEVLWDMLRAQELAQHSSIDDTAMKLFDVHTGLYDKVFQIHGTSKNEFKTSLNFYHGRPDLLKPIFDTLNNRSEKMLQLAPPQ